MVGKDLDLTIRGHDQASKELRDVKESAKGVIKATEEQAEASKTLSMRYTEMVSALRLVQMGMQAVQKVVGATIGEWLEHTKAVADFNAMIDGNIKETSVLIEISKDFDITMDTLLASMRTLASRGYEPNIEGLITIRGLLDDCTTESERLKLAQQMLGEQGIKQIIPMLDQLTNEQLRNYIDTMTEAEIITEAEVEQARQLQKAISDMGDAWDSVKISLGGWAAPGVTAFLELLNRPFDPNSAAVFLREFFGMEFSGDQVDREFTIVKNALDELGLGFDGARKAVEDLTEAEYLLMAAQALIAGDTVMAQFWAGMAREAEQYATRIGEIISLLDAYDGKVVTAEMMLRIKQVGGAFDPNAFERQLWQERHESSTSGGAGGVVRFGGKTFKDAYWRGNQLIVRGKVYGTFPGHQLGGRWTIPGSGGPDSELVQFRGTPGEEVKVTPPGVGDNFEPLLAEIRAMRLEFSRLANTLPVTLRDAVERAL